MPEPEARSPNGEPEEGDILWEEADDDLEASGGLSDLLGFDLSGDPGLDRSGLNALINSAIVAQRRLPMLDVIFDRTARRMTRSLRQLTDENLEVGLEDVATCRFGDFLHTHERASVIAVLHSAPLDAYALIMTDASLMLAVLDLLLGGRRGDIGFFDDSRALTPIELGLAERIITSIVDDFNQSFSSVFETAFKLERLELTPRFAAIAQEPSVCAVGKFKVSMGERKAHAVIVLPHNAIEPVREALKRDFIGEQSKGDGLWRMRLDAEVKAASLDVDAIVAERTLSLDEVKKLSVGDLLVFPATPEGSIVLSANGCAVAEARLGKAGDRVAVRLTEVIGPSRRAALLENAK